MVTAYLNKAVGMITCPPPSGEIALLGQHKLTEGHYELKGHLLTSEHLSAQYLAAFWENFPESIVGFAFPLTLRPVVGKVRDQPH